ncbi:DNA mismatch repair protein [Orbilia ellipsospora]|uniref:DNA mismatch repair protein n=1 Tax=Orbilia ellipsospora TaxID=2528407 RepID=A0AAV9XDU5_9PEZI
MEPARIKLLSDSVISQLRSTVTLTSLAGAVQELLMNSLDANATIVEISINVQKNSLVIEDNGDGIVPADMQLLGSRYYTSKSAYSPTPQFGYRGEFLSSLASSSLLTVWSRSKDYRSTHTVRYHYGSRLMCALVESYMFMLPRGGTKVMVDRLFGNYPVRMVARENMTPAEVSKEWRDVKRKIVEAILLVERPIKIVVRDENRAVKVAFRGLTQAENSQEMWKKVLEEAGHAKIPWERAAASWSGFDMQGMVGLRPVTDTEGQFIFMNGFPISKNSNSALYSTINRRFAASSFAMTAEREVTEEEKRHGVGRGVEKHPSFVIFVTANGGRVANAEGLELYGANGIVTDVSRLLEIMVDEFLKVGGWKKATTKRTAEEDADASSRHTKKVGWRNRADIAFDPDPEMFSNGKSSVGCTTPRSGAVLRDISATASNRCSTEIQNTPAIAPTRLTLLPKDRLASLVTSTDWAKDVVSKFQNPVFKRPEARIPQTTLSENTIPDTNERLAKIPKGALKTAHVIAQVDEKYILIVLQSPHLVVMVDQHAADERVRVERLWRTYGCSPKPLPKPVSFVVAPDEYQILELYMPHMREWGFEFQMTILRGGAGGYRVDVSGVQELVADRYFSEPTLVVKLLRTWIAELKESGRLERFPRSGDWTKRMIRATKVLVEVFNSRACRSACMFNDELTLIECEHLIEQLANCDFPFQCAHGRPSMVPLVDIMPGGVQKNFDLDQGSAIFAKPVDL